MSNTYSQPGTSLPAAYAHTIDYFSKGIDQRGPFYHVKYYIDNWTDTDTFINALLGFVDNAGGSYSYHGPHQHPLSPNLFCVSATCEGQGEPQLNSDGYPLFPDGRKAGGALITAEYRAWTPYDFTAEQNPQMQIDPTTPLLWCTQEIEFLTELYTVPSAKVTYSSGTYAGQPVRSYSYRIRVPVTVYVLTFHRVPYLPVSTIRSLQGYVNSATFLGVGAGYLYFAGARTTREFNTDGTVVAKVQLTFHERAGSASSQKWNSLPNPDLDWTPVAGPGGQKLYPTGDFTPLAGI